VTGEIIKAISKDGHPGLVFCPVQIITMYVENIPYEVSKGINAYIASHLPDSDYVVKAIDANDGKMFGKIPCAEGKHELSETKYVFGLILGADGQSVDSYAILPLSSTKLGPLKKWLTSLYSVKANNPPLYAFRCVIKTAKQVNKKGADTYNIVVTPFGGTNWKECLVNPGEDWGAHILGQGKKMFQAIEDRVISVDFKSMSEDDVKSAGSSSAKVSGDQEEVPY